MVTTMRNWLAAVLLLLAAGEVNAQTNGVSTLPNAQALALYNGLSQPTCTLTAASTVVSDAVTCPTNSKNSPQVNAVTLTGASTLGLPGHMPAAGGENFLYMVTHSGSADGPTLAAGFEYPGAAQPPSCNGSTITQNCWSSGTQTDWLSCSSIDATHIGCAPVLTNMAAIGDTWQAPGSAGCNSNIALSNSNLTATQPTTGSQFGCLATTSHATGQYYFFLTATSSDTNSSWFGGIANASVGLATYLGADNNGISLKSGNFFFNNTNTSATGPTITTGTIIRFDIDLTNKQLGVNVSGTEYPSGCVITTLTGCYSFSTWAGGAAFPAFSGSGNAVDAATLNTSSGAGPGGSFVLWQ